MLPGSLLISIWTLILIKTGSLNAKTLQDLQVIALLCPSTLWPKHQFIKMQKYSQIHPSYLFNN